LSSHLVHADQYGRGKMQMLQKLCKMSVREAISIVAGPRKWGDTRDSWLARASDRLDGVSFRTLRSLWYGSICEGHWAAREVRRQAELIEARKEAQMLAADYEKIARGMDENDPSVHREDVAALLQAARILRDLDRT
jgi:hypothetical protein